MPVIIPAAIAIVALLLLIPTVMLRGKIKAKLSESANVAGEVDSTLYTAESSRQPEIAINIRTAIRPTPMKLTGWRCRLLKGNC